MRIGKVVAQLRANRQRWAASANGGMFASQDSPITSQLSEIEAFGSNPGNLRMLTFVPSHPAAKPPLVVVLHGCTQTAASYDHGTGWSELAEQQGFLLLFPEQRPANNPKSCFSWFQASDTRRDDGEALSIRQMIARMVADHDVDPHRIFITGLSAGGAMTSVMLATYPEVFAGGAILAGLPYGAADSVGEAFGSMFQGRSNSAQEWGDLVRAASRHHGPWPRVSVWHGSADTTVVPLNAAEIVKQWTNVHGLSATPDAEDRVDGFPHRIWRGPDGAVAVEEYSVTGMAHGTPLAVAGQENPHGAAGPFLLDVGIDSTERIALSWGLIEGGARHRTKRPESANGSHAGPRPELLGNGTAVRDEGDLRTGRGRAAPSSPHDVGGIIRRALEAAGLTTK
jgi:poly(hydroxyalkanoate) depolymerase family esterase